MEIFESLSSPVYSAVFKIDLIVWKLSVVSFYRHFEIEFKIDLIVWKSI